MNQNWCKSVPAKSVTLAGNRARLQFNLKNYSTKAEVMAAIDRVNYLGFNTNLTGGLKVARTEVFDPDYAKRPYIDRLIVLITDGVPTRDADKLDAEVTALKRMGVRIIGLGVTNMVSLTSVILMPMMLLTCYIYRSDLKTSPCVCERNETGILWAYIEKERGLPGEEINTQDDMERQNRLIE